MTVSVDCLCIVLYDVLYINIEPWSTQDITKQQIMYVCIKYMVLLKTFDGTLSVSDRFVLKIFFYGVK